MKRRDFLALSATSIATAAINTRASAQASNWPNRPVRLIVPYAPGGASDIIARPWAEALSRSFGQQFVVENRGGAGGMIGTEAAMKATPDGYSLLLTPSATMSILPVLRPVPYDPQKSFVPVARIGDTINGFVIHPSTGLKTMKETIDYAKANPGKLAYGSAGLGTIQQLRIEMLKYRAGVDILHVPYRGAGDALTDLLAGQIQMMNEINVLPHAKAGKLTLLSISAPQRSSDFPDTPTLTEVGYPNSDLSSWYSIWAPSETPPEIVEKLHARINDLMQTDAVKQMLRQISVSPVQQTPAEMSKYLATDLKTIGDLVKMANIKLE